MLFSNDLCNSFFSTFNGKYETYVKKEKENSSGTPRGGSYFAFILKEVFENSHELLNILLKMKERKWQFNTNNLMLSLEEPFEGENKNRRIDLFACDDNYSLDIEIKWDDKFHDTQPDDYLKRLQDKNGNHNFILLTKNRDVWSEDEKTNLSEEKKYEIEKHHILLSDFYNETQKYFKKLCLRKNIEKYAKEIGIIKLFLEFLEENIMSYKEKINGVALVKFMEASCGWKFNADGRNASKQSKLLFSIPDLLFTLMNNINIIAIENVYKDFGKFFSKKGWDDFVCLSKIPANIDKDKKYIGSNFLNTECYSSGGVFIVYHRFLISKLKKYLDIGLMFSLDSKKKNNGIDISSYVRCDKSLHIKNIGKIIERGKDLSEISLVSQEKLYNKMKDDITVVLQDAGVSL